MDSTGVNSSNLNSSPQNLLDVKDVVAQVAMRYKGPPGGVESTAWECRSAARRLAVFGKESKMKKRQCFLKLVVGVVGAVPRHEGVGVGDVVGEEGVDRVNMQGAVNSLAPPCTGCC